MSDILMKLSVMPAEEQSQYMKDMSTQDIMEICCKYPKLVTDYNVPLLTVLKTRSEPWLSDPKAFMNNIHEVTRLLEGTFTAEERALLNRRAVGKEESNEKSRLKSRMRKWRRKLYKELFNEECKSSESEERHEMPLPLPLPLPLPPLPQSPVETHDIVIEENLLAENASLKAALRQMEDTLLGHASTVMEFAALQEEMAYMEACNKDMMRRLVAMEGELEAARTLADMSVRQLKAQREAIMIILGV
jgi:hypothetical protein